jgi:acyl-CoA synthetase (AMP-forming)/AMP-acid ligase II
MAATFPRVLINDGFGSSETGAQGTHRNPAGDTDEGRPRFKPMDDTTVVLDEETRTPVEPGSDTVGRVAMRGHIPLGYHNDPEKTAATFVTIDGVRWVITGDMATVDDDGTINLLGRGSGCINTGGEKVFAEEVETVLKRHGGVYDAVVVGVPDERWGQSVAAVVQPVEGTAPTTEDLESHCREHLAGYKVPRRILLVDEVVRSPVGKADYRWAADTAMSRQ